MGFVGWRVGGRSGLRPYIFDLVWGDTGREISANVGADGTSLAGNAIGIPIGTMTYTIATFTTARLATKVDLLAIGQLLVHLHCSLPRRRSLPLHPTRSV